MTDSTPIAVSRPPSDEGAVAQAQPPRRRGRTIVIVALAVAVLMVVVLAVTVIPGIAAPPSVAASAAPLSTVPVTTGNMVSVTNAQATLHYSQERPLVAASSGVVTALPAAKEVIVPGATLYRLNNQPVILLRGSLPAWRTLERGVSPGEDVRQLEENLSALGLFRGDVDTTFTRLTADAITAWQESLGLERTGRVEPSAILFADHDLRVMSVTVEVGIEAAPGTELYRVSATTKFVDLDLKLGDQHLAVVGNEVGIVLPDGTSTTGTIATVGEPLERESNTGAAGGGATSAGTFVVPVTVTLTDQAAVAAFSRASVTVQFASTLAEGVLTVPVEALIATDATTFAVETTTKGGEGVVHRIPVTIGAFASGRVQISGKGIREGLPVVVPAS